MIRVASSFIAVCLCLFSTIRAQADSIVTVPLASPVHISLEADPVVRFTNGITDVRIIDFTPNLGQGFILFEAVGPSTSGPMPATGFRFTIGARARDGLASITGKFAPLIPPTNASQASLLARPPALRLGDRGMECALFDHLDGRRRRRPPRQLRDARSGTGAETSTTEPVANSISSAYAGCPTWSRAIVLGGILRTPGPRQTT
jgi:hypothetical protein